MNNTTSARIFQESDGYHYCDASLPYLDARGRAFRNKATAYRAAYRAGFTHAMISDRRRTICGAVSLDNWDHLEHRRWLEVAK